MIESLQKLQRIRLSSEKGYKQKTNMTHSNEIMNKAAIFIAAIAKHTHTHTGDIFGGNALCASIDHKVNHAIDGCTFQCSRH